MFASAARTPSRLRETVSAFEDIGTVKASGGHHRQFQLTGRQRPADVHEMIVNILFAKPQHLRKITSGVFSASQYIDHILPDSSHLPSVHECSCPRDIDSGIVSHPMPRAPNRTFFVGYCIRFVKARGIREHCTAHSDSQSQRGRCGRVACVLRCVAAVPMLIFEPNGSHRGVLPAWWGTDHSEVYSVIH